MAFAGFVVRFLVVTVGFAVLHYYLWWRLFRDTTKRGSVWRPIGAVVLGVLTVLGLLARMYAPSEAPMRFQELVGWPGWIWFGIFMYLFGLLIVGEALRFVLIRRARRGMSEAEIAADRADGFWHHLRSILILLRLWRPSAAPPVDVSNTSHATAAGGETATARTGNTSHGTGQTRRRVMSRAIGLSASTLAVATVGHGLYEGYRTPPLKPVAVNLARLPRQFDGYRIAVIGDTHFSAIRGREYCQRVVDQINRAQADLIAFVGDLASNEADQVRDATDPLAGLEARDGTFFVSGNAEHYVGADEWYDRVAELGMIGLPNTRVELAGFDLAGVNDLIVEQRHLVDETGPDFEAALGDRDPARPVILMAHQPNAVDRVAEYGVDLQLSGHTHGGQMWPVHYASLIRSGQLSGLERHGDTQVYVTNGAGTNGPPIRVGADADITVMTLRAGELAPIVGARRYRRAMDIILIPGFWLDASSWSEITPALEKAGHRTHPLTLPGMESRDADRSGIGLRDHIDAVVAAVDALEGPVVLVGHSAGGAIAHAVADARPDRIARVVYVDSAPLGPGGVVNDELPVVDGEIPLPDWNVFEDEDLVDLDDDLREAFRAKAIPSPWGAAFDKQVLGDERRFDVPITLICCEFGSAMVRAWIEQGVPFVKELAAVKDIAYIDLPTGHWPQFTKPAELADAIVSAVGHA